jgi:hypothetical protein
MNATIEIFDPAMCCSTGVCGTDVDDTLADFANNLKWLKSRGVEVRRFNLGQEPEVFKSNTHILARLQKEGTNVLPVILVNNKVTSEGGYPDRNQLCAWLGINTDTTTNNDSEAFKNNLLQNLMHTVIVGDTAKMSAQFLEGKANGIDLPDLVQAMQSGLNERQANTQQLLQTANELLGVPQNGCTPGGGCC